MEKSEQIRLLKQMMSHLDNGTNVDAGGLRRNPTSVPGWPVSWGSGVTVTFSTFCASR